MKKFYSILILLSLVLLISCAAHTNLEPVGKGNISGNVNIGGPIIKIFGIKMPVPYATVGANYGLTNKFDLNGNLHLFSLGYKIFGFDFGSTWYPCINNGKIPTIGIQPRLLTLVSLKSDVSEQIKAYPIVSGSAAWELNKHLIYIGTDITVPFTSLDYDKNAPNPIFSPFWGCKWKIGKRTYLLTEIKWHAANAQTDQLAVEYVPLNNYGAISTLFSIERSF